MKAHSRQCAGGSCRTRRVEGAIAIGDSSSAAAVAMLEVEAPLVAAITQHLELIWNHYRGGHISR